jgi:PKD repeat protein
LENATFRYSKVRYCEKGAILADGMGAEIQSPTRLLVILLTLVIMTSSLAGCTTLSGVQATEPMAQLRVYPEEIEAGESITFDARESDPIEGVITEFRWDFGDESTSETIVGFTSHRYADWGTYVVTLTVVNDQGGEDTVSQQVRVNGAPVVKLEKPEMVRSGDVVILDASASHDPEGGSLDYVWDLDWANDSNTDGDARNDIDSTNDTAIIEANTSGNITGSLTVTDDHGTATIEYWSIEVKTRHWAVEWSEKTVVHNWSGYLDQGDEWEGLHNPGIDGIIISVDALLELERDIIEPQDNFTLNIAVPSSGWYAEAKTGGGNITSNESASAEIERSAMNPIPEGGEYSADSQDILLAQLLNSPATSYGQGGWIWSVVANEADPDSFVEPIPDPDPGNTWDLTATFVILVPLIVELA